MNGRVFDYNLGRFYSVDPFIVDPGNGQAMNPYAYVLNNPLSYKDPSGYEVKNVVVHVKVNQGGRIKTSVDVVVQVDTANNTAKVVGVAGGNGAAKSAAIAKVDGIAQGGAKAITAIGGQSSQAPVGTTSQTESSNDYSAWENAGDTFIEGIMNATAAGDFKAAYDNYQKGNYWSAAGNALMGGCNGLKVCKVLDGWTMIGKGSIKWVSKAVDNAKVSRKAAKGDVAKSGDNLVYRGGSGTPTNLTPRAKDTKGLSGNVNPMPGKNQVIDTSKLDKLCAVCDNAKTGHVSIKPKNMSQMQGWIDSRGSDITHPLTQELMDAVVDQVKK